MHPSISDIYNHELSIQALTISIKFNPQRIKGIFLNRVDPTYFSHSPGPAGTQKRWNEIKNAFTVAEALRPKPLPASTTQAANTGRDIYFY